VQASLERTAHDGAVGVDPSPIPDVCGSLIDEHAEAVKNSAATGFRVADQPRTRLIGDHVRDRHARAEAVGVNVELGVDVGKQPNRCGVDNDVGCIWNDVRPIPRHELSIDLVASLSRVKSCEPRS
jgi:hypothetical protein